MAYGYPKKPDEVAVLKERLKQNALGGVWLLGGEESYLSRYYLSLIRKKIIPDEELGYFDRICLRGGETVLSSAVAGAVESLPVMNEGKLIEISEPSFAEMGQNEQKDFCAVLAAVPDYPYATVVISCTEEEFPTADYAAQRSPLRLALEKAGVHIVVSERQSPEKLRGWCQKHFASEQVEVAPTVIAAMIDRCGTSMEALRGEMGKLCAYAKANGKSVLSMDDMLSVTSPVEESEDFGIQSAIRDRDGARLFRQYTVLKHRKEDPMRIFFLVSSAVTELWNVKNALADGLGKDEIMSLYKMKDYPARLAIAACKKYTPEALTAIFDACVRTDLQMKSSGIDGYILIERLLCTVLSA